MSIPPKPPVPAVEVPDPAEAMRKTVEFARRVLSVPKPAADGIPKTKAGQKRQAR